MDSAVNPEMQKNNNDDGSNKDENLLSEDDTDNSHISEEQVDFGSQVGQSASEEIGPDTGMAVVRKPVRLWNAARTIKCSLVVNSLDQLMARGCQKLDIQVDQLQQQALDIVLEEDGTMVDEDEYFQLLPSDTTFMLLRPGEKWSAKGLGPTGGLDMPDSVGGEHAWRPAARLLQGNLAHVLTLSSAELASLGNAPTDQLAQALMASEEGARSIQTACLQAVDDRARTQEAMDLLKIYHTAKNAQ